jgi:hypothetical protein
MKTLCLLFIISSLTPYAYARMPQTPKPLSSVWHAIVSGPHTDAIAYDMTRVDFTKLGTYECAIRTADNKIIKTTIRIDRTEGDACFELANTDTDIDPFFCTYRSEKGGLRWFSNKLFAEYPDQTNAAAHAFVELQ